MIKGSDNIEDYPLIPSRMEGRSIYYHAALINAYHVDGFEINGPGTINGNGYKFWVQFWDNVERAREENRSWTNPLKCAARAFVFLWGCDNARLSGARRINSGSGLSLYLVYDLIVENARCRRRVSLSELRSSDAIGS